MFDFDEMRAKHPLWACPDGPAVLTIELTDRDDVITCLAVDGNGDLIGEPPQDAISVRWKYTTMMRSLSGHVAYSVRYDPPASKSPVVIGILMSKERAIGLVESDESKRTLALCDATSFVYTPANCIVEYTSELPLIDPAELGIKIDIPPTAA